MLSVVTALWWRTGQLGMHVAVLVRLLHFRPVPAQHRERGGVPRGGLGVEFTDAERGGERQQLGEGGRTDTATTPGAADPCADLVAVVVSPLQADNAHDVAIGDDRQPELAVRPVESRPPSAVELAKRVLSLCRPPGAPRVRWHHVIGFSILDGDEQQGLQRLVVDRSEDDVGHADASSRRASVSLVAHDAVLSSAGGGRLSVEFAVACSTCDNSGVDCGPLRTAVPGLGCAVRHGPRSAALLIRVSAAPR